MGGSVLVIGVGGLGGAAVGAFSRDLTRLKKRIKTEYSENSREAPRIFTVVLDTDRSDLERVSPYTDVVSLALDEKEIDRAVMHQRTKGTLAFLQTLNRKELRASLDRVIEEFAHSGNGPHDLYIVTSMTGDTGSGCFIRVAFYVSDLMRAYGIDLRAKSAVLLMPEGAYLSELNVKHMADNADAVVRELSEPSDPQDRPFDGVSFVRGSFSSVDEAAAGSLYTLIIRKDLPSLLMSDSLDLDFYIPSSACGTVYESVGVARIEYPLDAIARYIAYRKTVTDCGETWISACNAAKEKMASMREECEAKKLPFILRDGQYAELWLAALEEKAQSEPAQADGFDAYLEKIFHVCTGVIRSSKRVSEEISEIPISDLVRKGRLVSIFAGKDRVLKRAKQREEVMRIRDEAHDRLRAYYDFCVQAIHTEARRIAGGILPLETGFDPTEDKQYSLVANLFQRNGRFIHPIAAMRQLCRFRLALTKKMEENRKTVSFDSLSTDSSIDRVLADLPIPALRGALRDADRARSLYLSYAHGVRFLSIAGADKKDYLDPNIITDPLMDAEAIKSDARAYAVSLEFLARGMLLALALRLVAERVDELISQYTAFFDALECECRGRKDGRSFFGWIGNGYDTNVYVKCSPQDLDSAFSEYQKGSAVCSEDALAFESDAGERVFSFVYANACAKKEGLPPLLTTVTDVCSDIEKMNGALIEKSDFYAAYSHCDPIRLLSQSNHGDVVDLIRDYIAQAFVKARSHVISVKDPAVCERRNDFVIFSRATAQYVYEHRSAFGIRDDALAQSDNTRCKLAVDALLRSCGIFANAVISDIVPDGYMSAVSLLRKITPRELTDAR